MEFLFTPWKLAMYAVLGLLLWQAWRGHRLPVHKVRTWCALIGSSIAAHTVAPAFGTVPLAWNTAIDGIAALIILVRPAGLAQKAIGLIYGVMIFYAMREAGIQFYSGNPLIGEDYQLFMLACGWCQFAILFVWSARDAGRTMRNPFYRSGSNMATSGQADGANG